MSQDHGGGRQSREDLGLFLHVDLTDKLENTLIIIIVSSIASS
jgi:hypothetical protein